MNTRHMNLIRIARCDLRYALPHLSSLRIRKMNKSLDNRATLLVKLQAILVNDCQSTRTQMLADLEITNR